MTPIINPHNRLFELARSGKRLPPVLAAIVLAVVFIFGGQLIGAVPYLALTLFGWMPSNSTAFSSALYLIVFFTVTLTPSGLLLWLWLTLVEKRSMRTLGLEKSGSWGKFGRGLLVGSALFLAVALLIAAPGYLRMEGGFATIQFVGVALAGFVLPAWILQGSLEEFVIRGWLMPVIGARRSPLLGVFVSSLLFAILHLLNPGVTLLSAINLILAGLLFALFALWEGGIWGACGLHAAWNWIQGSVLGFPVSGMMLTGPSLIHLSENGPDLLTGGLFGPEGGLATTMVYLIGCAVLVWLIDRRNKANPKDTK